MISLDEINGEITKLENQQASYAVIEKLSWLYTVRDHLQPVPAGEIPHGDSDFMKCCAGKSVCEVMGVTDELMSVLMVVQPRLYNAVMDKLI